MAFGLRYPSARAPAIPLTRRTAGVTRQSVCRGGRRRDISGSGKARRVEESNCYCLSIECAPERGEAVSCWLVECGFEAIEERETPERVQLFVYGEDQAVLQRAATALAGQRVAAGQGPAPEIAVSEMDPSWRLAWTKYLQPVQVTRNVVVVPSAPPETRVAGELYLEPALAFGFGEHPSTTAIAPWLEEACRANLDASVLDVGCGTGVLSLVAATTGVRATTGVDTSQEAVASARTNAANNGLANKIEFIHGSASSVNGQFEIVCANIESGILIEIASDISNRVARGGRIALAGLLYEQQQEVIAAYRQYGIRLSEVPPGSMEWEDGHRDEEWTLLAGIRD